MVESTLRHGVSQNVLATMISSLSDVGWQDKLTAVESKNEISFKTEQDRNQDNNQDDEKSVDKSSQVLHSLQFKDVITKLSEVQYLRNENASLNQRLTQIESVYAQNLEKLEMKLKQTVETHVAIEQRLRSRLLSVLQEQQEAVENARKVRSIISRISDWMHQVQQATQRKCSGHKSFVLDIEPCVTPHSEAPYKLWSKGVHLATNIPECEKSPTSSIQYEMDRKHSLKLVPPIVFSRNRAKSLPAQGSNYVENAMPSLLVEKSIHPYERSEVIVDGLPSISATGNRGSRASKRSASNILAYCAQVVSTSLTSVGSSKVDSVWRRDPINADKQDVDEEAGQCWRLPIETEPQDVALPNLSIGLL
ncbi:uncharacterized protein PHALS_06395 [Plasmopara halstedii]|uniref:Uncharacterized protein n=1 Tax=Plasmopara halstedii TaxID=4781 RepID=A0A0N7L811_PLAHL|nr:uncharacterized protein PHALS_06395 [Plasmopara halstedii]CEG48579.1 hypothetical protein PHALS_06395 [Plasmopara halstedii]|eukprot:XP_024584948.1 hypothetical protein PHALS_06395 [Plasmopara halstedii]